MNPMRELAWHERHFLALVVGGLPSLVIGFILGLWGDEIGGREVDLPTVLMRGGYCALFPVIMASFMPRAWVLPALAYTLGFSFGYAGHSNLGEAVIVLVNLSLVAIERITGEPHVIYPAPPPSQPDLPWILGIALWLGGLTSILRRNTRFVALIRRLEIRD